MTPKPVQKPHPPIYVGSWGSDAGLTRLAKYSNGWMASAYNISPTKFKEKWNFLLAYRKSLGKQDIESFDNSTMSMFVISMMTKTRFAWSLKIYWLQC